MNCPADLEHNLLQNVYGFQLVTETVMKQCSSDWPTSHSSFQADVSELYSFFKKGEPFTTSSL